MCLPYRDMDPPDDPTSFFIRYKLDGMEVDAEDFRGDYGDAELQAERQLATLLREWPEAKGEYVIEVSEKD